MMWFGFAAWPWFPVWWLEVAILADLAAIAAIVYRDRLRRVLALVKALATDERLPRPLRWALKVGIAVKALPVPDFGVDELLLGVSALLLLTVYRPTLRAIVAETKEKP